MCKGGQWYMVRLLGGHSNPHIEALGVIPSGPFVIFRVQYKVARIMLPLPFGGPEPNPNEMIGF